MLNLGFFAPSPAAATAPSPSQEPSAPVDAPRLKEHPKLFAFGVGYDFVIVSVCLWCLYLTASEDGKAALFFVVIRAGLAVSELARAPVAYLARVHSSAAWRHGLTASALLFAFITAWNLFLPLDQGMRELIAAPQETAAALQEAEATPERLRAEVAEKRKEHDKALGREKDASDALGGLPAQHCWKRHCQTDPRVAAMNAGKAAATKDVADTQTKLNAAEKDLREAEGPKGAAALRKLQDDHRHAVNKNMVYGAVATLLGVDPVKISPSEMSWAFRLMTITVCVAAGLVGSVICLASVERLPVPKPARKIEAPAAELVEVPDELPLAIMTAAANKIAEAAASRVSDKLIGDMERAEKPAANDNEKSPLVVAFRKLVKKAKAKRPTKAKASRKTDAAPKGNGSIAPVATRPRGRPPKPDSANPAN